MITVLVLLVLFTVYSWFFRTYLEPMQYLELAWSSVEYDPYISNWQDPEFELIWEGLRPTIKFTFFLDRTRVRRKIVVTIDPLTKDVLVDGRTPEN